METDKIDIAENIFRMVKNLSADVKLEIISKIADSLKEPKSKGEAKDESWKKLFGAWESEESAEEIIEEIRASRYTNRQVEDL